MKLYCATGNPGKLREFRMAAAESGLELEMLPRFRDLPRCEETGRTFRENAIQKAMHYGRYADGPLFADDSGLEVDALGGAPGVYSARFAGAGATDEDNNRLLLEKLRGVENRTARFVCAIALVAGGRLLGTFRGAVEGRIIDEARGPHGFGYDPLFYYEPFGLTFGEAGNDRKMTVSHRGQALREMIAFYRNSGSSVRGS
ncbi:MAG: RdgB/HAM1 family non-canonical purine NTP pyrophosphatase [Bryobacteraceae bacterium]